MKIAVEGCAHGELDKIYEVLTHLETENKIKVDLLIICGDFQSVRNQKDLSCMAVSQKFRKLNTFYKYHSGEKVAPVLTIFIGGNHEASNYLSELYYGGWVCPNIYYLGRAGVLRVNGLRIAGISGIFKGHDYLRGHFEHYPFSEDTKRSVYHVRNLEVFRLKQLQEPIHIFISHDWPRGVYNYGNIPALLRRKEFFRKEVESNTLGSRPCEDLLKELKPSYWFAAHLHCKFAAIVPHPASEGTEKKETNFLALDKCLPRRRFLQVLDIGPPLEPGTQVVLEHDPEWLAILCSTNHLLKMSKQPQYMPGPGSLERWQFSPTEEEKKVVCARMESLVISPELFVKTACSHGRSNEGPFPPINPQTLRICKALGLTDPLVELSSELSSETSEISLPNEEELSASEEDELPSDSEPSGIITSSLNTDDLDDEEEYPEGSGVDGLFIIDRRRSGQSSESCTPRRSKLLLSSPLNNSSFCSLDTSGSELNDIKEFSDLGVLSSGGTSKSAEESDKGTSSESDPLQQCDTDNGASLIKKSSESGHDDDRKRTSFEENEPLPTPKRTMKRRNVGIYQSPADDDDDDN